MNKYESLRLVNQLCFPLYLCSKEVISKYKPFLDEINLTYTQYVVMMYLWEEKEANVKQIGDALFLESSTLTPLLKRLEKKEYITRNKNEKDERQMIISLTKKGMNLRDKALSVPERMKCYNTLTQSETVQLYKLLYKLLDN